MSVKYKSNLTHHCILCNVKINKGEDVERIERKRPPVRYVHAECYAKEKGKGERKT